MNRSTGKGLRRRDAARVVGAALTCAGLFFASGCTTLPGRSAPEAISSYVPTPHVEDVIKPQDNRPPDLLLRDFFSASSHPVGKHKAAKLFLTPTEAERWNPGRQIMVLDRIFINSDSEQRDGSVTYRVRGNVIGTLGVGGVFTPEYTAYETTYELHLIDGQWRIADLHDGVIMDRSDFVSSYDARPVYFVDPKGEALVPDRRWIYTRQQSMGSSLISLLSTGPQVLLRRGVHTFFPEGATVQTRKKEGVFEVDMTGLTELSQPDRMHLAAQVVWTLASGDVRGPYRLLADGAPLSEEVGEVWHVNDVSRFDPRVSAAVPLRAVAGGQVVELNDDASTTTAQPGWLNTNFVESLAVSGRDNVFAAVTGQGDEPRRLMVGSQGEEPQEALSAHSLTRPTWGVDASVMYSVADGKKVVRVTRSAATGGLSVDDIGTDALRGLGDKARISMLRMSRDGTRAALLINGRVYVSVLERLEDGKTRLGELVEIGYQLGDTAVSVDWQNDGSILVGTRANDAPVWIIAADGSSASQITARNISAPVVSLGSNGDYFFATDDRAMMMLSRNAPDPKFWREVPGLRGVRAVPVLAH